MEKEYIIMAPQKDLPLATAIADKLDLPIAGIDLKKINESETVVDIKSYVNHKTVFLIFNLNTPINDSLMNLFFTSDLLKKQGAQKIHLFLPYFPYTKIPDDLITSIDLNLIIRFIEVSGIDSIYTFDMFNPQITSAINIPIYNISMKRVFSKTLEEKYRSNKDLVATTIDFEFQYRARDIAKEIKSKFVTVNKYFKDFEETYEIESNINNKDVLVIGNLIVSAQILTNFANYLTTKGARTVSILATHGVFSEGAVNRLEKSVIKDIYVCTAAKQKYSKKIKVISYINIIKEIIERIIDQKSIKSYTN
jgi:ribose-phosphate pyrophosphokinase